MDIFIAIIDIIFNSISQIFDLMMSSWLTATFLVLGIVSIIVNLLLIIRGKK